MKEELEKEFERIKEIGLIKSVYKGYGGIGMTLEKLLNIPQNSFEIPDLGTFQLKAKNVLSKSYITLFNCAVEGPYFKGTERLKDLYGYRYCDNKNYKVLVASISSIQKTKVGIFYYFKLKVDRIKQKLFLEAYDLKGNLIEDKVYWSFDLLKEKLERKVKNLALFGALRNTNKGETFYKYIELSFYKLKSFDYFIKAIEKGIIRVTFKISVFTSGKRIGQIHDHGTSFEVKEKDLSFLYEKC